MKKTIEEKMKIYRNPIYPGEKECMCASGCECLKHRNCGHKYNCKCTYNCNSVYGLAGPTGPTGATGVAGRIGPTGSTAPFIYTQHLLIGFDKVFSHYIAAFFSIKIRLLRLFSM